MWRIEIERLMRSKGFYISLGIGVVFALWHFFTWIFPMKSLLEEMISYDKGGVSIPSAYEYWMNSSTFPLPTYLFLMTLPILAVMPYGLTYDQDRKTGWIKNIYVRENKGRYLRIKLVLSFVSGMLTSVIPLILNFLLAATCLPLKPPQLINTGIQATNIWCGLFYNYPMCYIFLILLLVGIYGGLMAVLPIILSHSTDYSFLVGSMPFLYHLFLFALCNLLHCADYAPVRFLCGGVSVNYYIEYVLVGIIAVVICLIAYWRGRKTDVY